MLISVCIIWTRLIHDFQVRNKPIEPPKKPEKAPFFLPSVASLSGEVLFNPSDLANEEKEKKGDEMEKNRKILSLPPSQFLQLLQSSAEMKNCKLYLLFLLVSSTALNTTSSMFQAFS